MDVILVDFVDLALIVVVVPDVVVAVLDVDVFVAALVVVALDTLVLVADVVVIVLSGTVGTILI